MSSNISRRGLLRLGLAGAGGIGAAALVAGCSPYGRGSSASGGGTRVSWYGADPLHEAMATALKEFQKRSSTSIGTEHAAAADYWNKLATQTAARNAPDVMRMSVDTFSAYGDRGALLDLSTYVRSGQIDVSGMRDGVRQSGLLDGSQFGIGQSSITNAAFINTEAADEVGAARPPRDWTWDDLADWANGIRSDSHGKIHGTSDQAGHFELFLPYVRQLGTNPFSDDGSEILFDVEMLEQWWRFWADLRAAGGAPPAAITAGVTGFDNQPVVAGQSVLDFGWVQQIAFLQPLMDQTLDLVVPPGTSGGDPGYYVNSADMWSVASTTEAPDVAADLVNYLINDEFAIKTLGVNLGVPPSDRAVQILGLDAGSPAGKAVNYVDGLGDKTSDPPPPWPIPFQELAQVFTKTAQDIAFGATSPADGAQSYFEQARRAMSQAQ